jgi:hypothetical protein
MVGTLPAAPRPALRSEPGVPCQAQPAAWDRQRRREQSTKGKEKRSVPRTMRGEMRHGRAIGRERASIAPRHAASARCLRPAAVRR